MAELLWNKMEPQEKIPWHMTYDDTGFYAREYISGGGWQASLANGLINNLKKPLSVKGTNQWPHKLRAIERFGKELTQIFDKDQGYAVAAVPSSICRDDPQYDSRLDDVIAELCKHRKLIQVERPVGFATNHTPQHEREHRMSPAEVYALLEWYGFKGKPPGVLCLIDDLVTTGSHFKAIQKLINEHHPDTEVCGIFWGKTIWTHDDDEEDDDDD